MVPDVSVVVPVYNPGRHLRDCLDSVLDQTIGAGRVELIAVDDGSTDGSAEVLDGYAARFPDRVVVVHQPNSGGPATPCNVGLGMARGRYVYFLGSDDQLGPEALERMVAAADAWGSDVLAAKVVGVGRTWNQRLYRENVASVEFPGELLARAMSNTKLFRRALLVEHGIDYPLDLRVGSDQPFTLDAMLAARTISVLGDYDYYLALRRDDDSNLTFSTGWRTRLECLAAVVRHVESRVPAGADRDVLLTRHFDGELATLLREVWPALGEADRTVLEGTLVELARDLLTPGIEAELAPLTRARYRLLLAGRAGDLTALVDAEATPLPLQLGESGPQLDLRGLVEGVGPDQLRVPARHLRQTVARCFGPARVRVQGDVLEVVAPCLLPAAWAEGAELVLGRAPEGVAPGPRERSADEPAPPRPAWPAVLLDAPDARVLSVQVPLAELPRRPDRVRSVRWQLRLPDLVVTVPATTRDDVSLGTRGETLRSWRPDEAGRALVATSTAPAPTATAGDDGPAGPGAEPGESTGRPGTGLLQGLRSRLRPRPTTDDGRRGH